MDVLRTSPQISGPHASARMFSLMAQCALSLPPRPWAPYLLSRDEGWRSVVCLPESGVHMHQRVCSRVLFHRPDTVHLFLVQGVSDSYLSHVSLYLGTTCITVCMSLLLFH